MMTGTPELQSGASRFVPRHASEEEYREFISGHSGGSKKTFHTYLYRRRRFVRAYPSLEDWFAAPLPERVGRVCRRGEEPVDRWYDRIVCKISYDARPYLFFLAIRGYLRFDLEWLIAARRLSVWSYLAYVGLDEAVEELTEAGIGLGYERDAAFQAANWAVCRIYLHTGNPDARSYGKAEVDALGEALRAFPERPDVEIFYPSRENCRRALGDHISQLYCFGAVLYHLGQTTELPRRSYPEGQERPVLKPRMEAMARRYVAARAPTVAPSTVPQLEFGLRAFIGWVAQAHPEVEGFEEVDRDLVLEYAAMMAETPSPLTGRPLTPSTRERRISVLSVFFRDTADWEWEGVPGRRLLSIGDYPKRVRRVPRYIPEDELPRLMGPIRSLACPFQRTALLVARWTGARRDEIRRLDLGCLDAYPDGSPRVRIPAGKTRKERVVPVDEEAAEAIRELQLLSQPGRGIPDPVTGRTTRYLFTKRGRLLSAPYLFDRALEKVCKEAGLPPVDGNKAVSAHRFRHTVGTQLAEKGAKLHTIMKVLGHDSPQMSMVYAQISDETVREDYEAVLGPGAAIAGPLAETLRSGELPDKDVEWIKRNFFKTELELGHCLRLPQEGPCECDLYLTCPKFVTTLEYAPRLRARKDRELELIEDAISNGWEREVERHRCTVRRIEGLLADLGEPPEELGDQR
jgi:integrase